MFRIIFVDEYSISRIYDAERLLLLPAAQSTTSGHNVLAAARVIHACIVVDGIYVRQEAAGAGAANRRIHRPRRTSGRLRTEMNGVGARALAVQRAHRHRRVHHRLAHVVQIVQQSIVFASIQRVQVELVGADQNANDGHDNVLDEAGSIPRVHDVATAAYI